MSIYHNKDGRRAHQFHCAGLGCKASILRYLDSGDTTSTGNLRKHVRNCKSWGEEVLDAADGMKSSDVRTRLRDLVRSGSIEKAFERVGKGRVSYSSRPHTRAETRLVFSCPSRHIDNSSPLLRQRGDREVGVQ